MSFFRFCWKNEKIDWPKCARTQLSYLGEENRGFQTDFVTVLDTSKRACTIKDSTVFFFA